MYLRYELPTGQLVVDQVRSMAAIYEVADQNLRIMSEAYSDEFESKVRYGQRALPAGSVARHFRPQDPSAIQANREHIETSMQKKGSRYWRAVLDGKQVGLGKLSPSYAHGAAGKALGERPNLYVNDLLVRPSEQGRGIGRALLHGMLNFSSGFDQAAEVVTDVYLGSRAETMIRSLGFISVGRVNQDNPVTIGSHELLQIRYQTAADQNLRSVIDTLEQRDKALTGVVYV